MNRVRSAAALALAGALSAWTPTAMAGAPMATEDADVLAPSECEWESTANRTTVSGFSVRTLATKAGCGLVPGTQLAFGLARTTAEGESANGLGLTGKTALIPRRDGGFGLTLAYGFAWAKEPGDSLRYAATTVTLVASQGVGDWTFHGNLGVTRFRAEGDSRSTWALGAEYALSPAVSALVETYGSEGNGSAWGAGLRWAASQSWSFGLMASQTQRSPKAKDVLLSAKLAF
ncbi:hypothetical protein [Inhella crocodyli]|uniref:Porin n=1 Tax=Inhella crocodyli TaxID=2499851 RepID=A0A437LE20_9BURK|nr:hypothetical protein [Inhella crocodyli]RVT83603.1 hypothetical protein EOD73_13560 [Inhella crocodyli]